MMSLDDMMSEESGDDMMSLDDMMSEENGDDMMSLDDMMSEDNGDTASSEETSDNGSIDNMLDGLLDNLDMTGSVEEVNPLNDTPFDITDNIPADFAETDDLSDLLPDIESKDEKTKKPGFFKKLFGNVVTDEIAEAERQAKADEEAKAEEDEQLKKEKEEAKKKLAEEKAAKKAEKAAAKAAKKAKLAEEKAAKKAEKEARKAEEAEAAANEVVGKLNKAGVAVIAVFAIIILAGVIIGTNLFGYNSSKKDAEEYFRLGKYEDAYKEVLGPKLNKNDPETYDKIVTVMKVQHALDSYSNYEEMRYYPDALNSLLKGLKKYDDNIEKARQLEVDDDLGSCKRRILGILSDEFGLSESEAYDILSLDTKAYTDKVVKTATEKY